MGLSSRVSSSNKFRVKVTYPPAAQCWGNWVQSFIAQGKVVAVQTKSEWETSAVAPLFLRLAPRWTGKFNVPAAMPLREESRVSSESKS